MKLFGQYTIYETTHDHYYYCVADGRNSRVKSPYVSVYMYQCYVINVTVPKRPETLIIPGD